MQYKRSRRNGEYTLGHPTLRANPALLAKVPGAFLSCAESPGSVKQVDAFLALLKGIPRVPSTDPARAVAQFYGLLREAVKSTVGWRIYPRRAGQPHRRGVVATVAAASFLSRVARRSSGRQGMAAPGATNGSAVVVATKYPSR
jgi:hypothetical protein